MLAKFAQDTIKRDCACRKMIGILTVSLARLRPDHYSRSHRRVRRVAEERITLRVAVLEPIQNSSCESKWQGTMIGVIPDTLEISGVLVAADPACADARIAPSRVD